MYFVLCFPVLWFYLPSVCVPQYSIYYTTYLEQISHFVSATRVSYGGGPRCEFWPIDRPSFRWLVVCLCLRRPGFDLVPVHVGFMAD
jgi:hypothetical protein